MLCLDIGGSHISSAVVKQLNDARIAVAYNRSAVESMADKESILSQWKYGIMKSIDNILGDIEAVFVSIPGPFDYENGISLMDGMNKYQSLLNMDVKSYLSEICAVDKEHIYFYNDAQAFLLGEIYHHKLKDTKVVGLTLGTGLGSALYENGIVNDLNYGSANFRNGISEDYISTRGIISYVNNRFGVKFNNVKELVSSNQHEKEVENSFRFLTEALAEFISIYVLPLKADYIVIGGSIAKSSHLFLENLQITTNIPIKIASMDDLNIFYGMISTTEV